MEMWKSWNCISRLQIFEVKALGCEASLWGDEKEEREKEAFRKCQAKMHPIFFLPSSDKLLINALLK